MDVVVSSLKKNNNSCTSMNACGHCENCLVFLNFDVIVPLIKSLYLIQRHLNNIKI